LKLTPSNCHTGLEKRSSGPSSPSTCIPLPPEVVPCTSFVPRPCIEIPTGRLSSTRFRSIINLWTHIRISDSQTLPYPQMVCPVCVATAVAANAPLLAAAFGGAAALKLSLKPRGAAACDRSTSSLSSRQPKASLSPVPIIVKESWWSAKVCDYLCEPVQK